MNAGTSPIVESYYRGGEEPPLIDLTISQWFDHIADEYPDQPAVVVSHQNIRWNYRQYQQAVDDVAAGLLALGIEKGDRVGIWSPNNIEWCLVQFATAKVGAIMVCINPAYRPHELEFALNNVSVKMLVMAEAFKSSNYIEMLESLVPDIAEGAVTDPINSERLPHLQQVCCIGEAARGKMRPFSDIAELATDETRQQVAEVAAQLDAHDAINIQFTSGTTGSPKGATLSHYNILNNGLLVADAMHLTYQDKLCIPVPLYHCFGMVLGNLVCLAKGSCAVFPNDAFDPLVTLQVVEQERCTALHGVPTMFIAELEHPQFEKFDLSSLRTGVMAGATCPEELMLKVQQLMHMEDVVIGYGQTECSPINHMTEIGSSLDKRTKTVGRAIPHTEIKIINEQGEVIDIGEKGEICARGYSVMQGYWEDEAKTKDTIDDEGWLHSGDLGVMDDEGYVAIVGRIKDMIIRGGENIYPREIEEVLYHHDSVQDAAVFGVPDRKFGEQVCLWLQLKEGATMTEEEVLEYLKERVAYFKLPKYIRFVETYPMTVTGKLQKFKMREQMIELIEKEST